MNTTTTSRDGGTIFWPIKELDTEEVTLLVIYCIVFVIGVTGNVLIILAACQNARHLPVRNNLLISLCISDLLVTAVSGPISAVMGLQKGSPSKLWACKLLFYIQSLPVAASTFSLMMLSLDRYVSVKHPRIVSRQFCQRHLSAFMICFSWFGACIVSSPVIIVRSIYLNECKEDWGTSLWRLIYLISYTIVVFVVPGVTVAVCHASVGNRLYMTASLLAAAPIVTAAATCELQLKHFRKPRQIVMIANKEQSKIIANDQDSSDEGGMKDLQIAADIALRKEQDLDIERKRQRRNSKAALSVGTKSDKTIIKAQRKLRTNTNLSRPVRPTLVKTYSAQSFRSRRRLATMLMALVAVFAACWIPYVICSITIELLPIDSSSKQFSLQLLPFFLLLGHAHSAINPVVYWLLNRNFLQKVQRALSIRSCVPLPLKIAQFRIPALNRNSSTNEAALGAFHPKYNIPKAGPPCYNRNIYNKR